MASVPLRTLPFPPLLLRVGRPAPVAPVALVLAAIAIAGFVLALISAATATPAATPAPLTPTIPPGTPEGVGDIPFIGDPIRDLTIWWSQRLSDANRAGIDGLRGHWLTPIDPLADKAVGDLYGKILLITIPLLTFGGVILGYLIMTSRTSGESAYTARSVTPRFIVGATLSILGIYLVSVFSQFIAAVDLAMVQIALPGKDVGGPADWPAAGGVFTVLQNTSFDPRIPEGPTNWNDGAWLTSGLASAVIVTFLTMMNAALGAIERLLVLVAPICLAAYALPATQRITNGWLKVLLTILVVRFAWTIVFVLFSLEATGHIGPDGLPPTVNDTSTMIGLANGCALLCLLLPLGLVPLAMTSPGPLRDAG